MKRNTRLFLCLLALVVLATAALIAVPYIRQQFYPREYSELVSKYCGEFNVPEPLAYAVIQTESDFDPDAASHVGAKGLMQLMPDTMDWLSRLLGEDKPTGDITDPETNIKYGVYYLRHLYDRFDDWDTALAAYNAGHGRVTSWLSDSRYSDDGKILKEIPFEETYNYVNKVNASRKQYEEIYYGED